MGKSVVLAQLGAAVTRAQLRGDGLGEQDQRLVPIKIPLVVLADFMLRNKLRGVAAGAQSFRQYLREHEKLTPSRVEFLQHVFKHGNLLLLLDGLDEATTQVENVLCWIDEIMKTYPRLRVVLSSRSVSGVDQTALESRGFRILSIQPLTPSQVRVRINCTLSRARFHTSFISSISF